MQKSSLLIFVHVFILLGCTFAPKDKYVSPISQPGSIKVSVDIQDPNFKDPFNLNVVTTFSFKINDITKPILEKQVLLDGNVISNVASDNNSLLFTLDPLELFDGSHQVKIRIKLDSKSGSLANQLGVEYYLIEKDFIVVVDKILPTYAGSPINFTIENGFLTLTWTKIDKQNFYYLIHHTGSSLSGDTVITDPSINKFVDYGYVGGPINYKISAVGFNTSTELVSGNYKTSAANFKVSATPEGKDFFSWNNPKLNLTNALVSIQETEWYRNWARYVPFSQDTLTTIKPTMGDRIKIKISVIRNAHPTYSYDTSIVYFPSNNFPKFASFQATESKKLFINYVYLTRVDLQNLNKEDSLLFDGNPFEIAASSDGNAGLIFDNSYPRLYKFDPNDFLQPRGYYYLNYMGPIKGSPTNVSVSYAPNHASSISNTNLGGINYTIYTDPINNIDPKNTAAIWDFSSGKAVWADTVNNDSPVISEDGNYFAVKSHAGFENWVYQNIGGTWNFIGKIVQGSKIFRNHGTAELIVITPSIVAVYDLAQPPNQDQYLSAVRSYSMGGDVPWPDKIGYDPASENVYFEYLDTFYDYPSNSTIKKSTIKVYSIQSLEYKGSGTAIVDYQNPALHVYSNGYHFLASGYAEKIQ